MLFNSEPTTSEQWKVKYAIYIYNEPRNFPNVKVLLSNFATTFECFDKRCVIFLQPLKCTNAVLKSTDHHNRMVWLSIRDWVWKLKSFSRKLRFFPPNVQISVSAANHKLKSRIDFFKRLLIDDFVPAIKLLTQQGRRDRFLKLWRWNVLWHSLNYHRKLRRKILKGRVYNIATRWFKKDSILGISEIHF